MAPKVITDLAAAAADPSVEVSLNVRPNPKAGHNVNLAWQFSHDNGDGSTTRTARQPLYIQLPLGTFGGRWTKFTHEAKETFGAGLSLNDIEQAPQLKKLVYDPVRSALCRPANARQTHEKYYLKVVKKLGLPSECSTWSPEEDKQFEKEMDTVIDDQELLFWSKDDENYNQNEAPSVMISANTVKVVDNNERMPIIQGTIQADDKGVPKILVKEGLEGDSPANFTRVDPSDFAGKFSPVDTGERNPKNGSRVYESKFYRKGLAIISINYMHISAAGKVKVQFRLSHFNIYNKMQDDEDEIEITAPVAAADRGVKRELAEADAEPADDEIDIEPADGAAKQKPSKGSKKSKK